jgi:site-specific recombinase XerD
MTNRLKMELLKLQLRFKHNNPDALVFEEAKVNLRKVWRTAYAEAGVPNGVRLFYSVRHAYATDMANKGMDYDSVQLFYEMLRWVNGPESMSELCRNTSISRAFG